MSKDIGIYTLANDIVFDQLIALVNSVKANVGADMPVCIIPYDDRLEKTREYVSTEENVTIFQDKEALSKWETFAEDIWRMHPSAFKEWEKEGVNGVYRLGMHRKFVAFDGEFDKFVFVDSDVLIMNDLSNIFDKIDDHQFVTYDYQYKDPNHVFDMTNDVAKNVFGQNRINSDIFCAGFFGSKNNIFDQKKTDSMLDALSSGDAGMLYINGPDQSILNYMVMKTELSYYNFGIEMDKNVRTGNTVVSSHFEEKEHILYDRGNKLTYLHYIRVPILAFHRICRGMNVDFLYRDLFLYYRYLKDQQKRPRLAGRLASCHNQNTLKQRVIRKVLGIK